MPSFAALLRLHLLTSSEFSFTNVNSLNLGFMRPRDFPSVNGLLRSVMLCRYLKLVKDST